MEADATLENGFNSYLFDAEACNTEESPDRQGRTKTYLHNTSTQKRYSTKKPHMREYLTIPLTCAETGDSSFDEMIRVKEGIYITKSGTPDSRTT
jgi:predicted Zn-dependent protease